MGARQLPIRAAAVCVYHAFVETAVEALDGSGIPVAAVSTGFPAGLSPYQQRIEEIRASVEAGAEEIDVVITRAHVLTENWSALYDEVRTMREACGDAHIKTILATGELATLANVARASPGVHDGGRRLHQDLDRQGAGERHAAGGPGDVSAIREYQERTGHLVGLKAAGGLRSAREALDWMALMKDELGDLWLRPDLFRIGASTLLSDIERQLEHFVTGRYSAAHRHPTA